MKKIILPLFICLISVWGCSKGLFDEINVNNMVPSAAVKPEVDSFSLDKIIKIKWKEDQGAKQYILYRSFHPYNGYTEVYRGEELTYEDNVSHFSAGKFFYYRVAKKRESMEFEKSDYAFGVAAQMRNDVWEENNTSDQAQSIDGNYRIYGTMWLYRDAFGNTIIDHDHYFISVEPNMYIQLSLNFENKPQNDSWDNYVYLFSSYSDNNGETIKENITFKLYNTFNQRRQLHFQFQLNEGDILKNPNEPGMQFISYALSNLGSEPIVPQN